MKRFVKKIITIILMLVFIFGWPVQALALTINAKSAILIDAATGQVLFEQNPDQLLIPASMTKLMTVYIAMDQIAKGKASLKTKVKITSATSGLSRDQTYSNVPLSTNRSYTLEELIASVLVVSACASAKAVAEYFGENEAHFVEMMNQYAKNMGLNASFADSSGISNKNQITARSMAILGDRLLKDFPGVLKYTSYSKLQFGEKTYENSNKMLAGMPQYYYGVDGLKTGFTTPAKHCFVSSAMLDDVRLVGVVMGVNSKEGRFAETKKLLDYGFALKNLHEPGRYAWAKPTASKVLVNGQAQTFAAYEIGNSNYFKLRDLALALNQTNSKFAIAWDLDNRAIALTSNSLYEPVGDEMKASGSEGIGSVAANPRVLLNGNKVRLMAFEIHDSYYFRLRDLGDILNFDVTWDDATEAIGIDAGLN